MRGYRRTDDGLLDADHRFTPEQKAEYDALTWRGRDFYDDARWNEGADHDTAIRDARHSYGAKA